MLTNSSGTVCYDSDNTPFGYEMAYTTSCPQDYQLAGMELDGGTGNYHTWFRYYEPNLGRWMTPDPLGLGVTDPTNPQSFNLYSYVMNDPTTLNDPLGLCDCEGGGAGFLGGCGGAGGGPGHIFIPPRLIPSPGPDPSPTSDPEGGGGGGGGETPAAQGNADFPNGSDVCDVIIFPGSPPSNKNCTQTTWSTDWLEVLGLSWPAAFLGDLTSLSSYAQAQQGAWNKGYYACLGSEMFGSPFSPGNNHLYLEGANQVIENTSLPERAAGVFYHFTDARFTAWGRYSKVLVPRAAKAIRLGAEKVNVAGWALTDVEMAKAINTCAGTL
jgi:RHS repeat-associated protein